jgi:iron only hydrogenase large subunit-like protein
MPVIASECPGWVCYAEKRVGDLAVEHMSHVKSPQQLYGVLTKLYYEE